MTRFFIDNHEIPVPFHISSIGEFLKHVEDAHLSPDAVVKEILVDGFPLITSPEEESELLYGIEKRDKIEIFTGTVVQIAHDSIADALEYLERVEAAIPSLVISCQANPVPESFEKIKQLYEGIYWLNLLLDKLKVNFQINPDGMMIQGVPASEYKRKFISVLKHMIESLERGDFLLISDLLEYEILPLVSVWREVFNMVSKKLDTAR